MVWLGTRLTQAILPGQFFLETGQKKPWSLHPPLTMQQDEKHACLTVCSLVVLAIAADLQGRAALAATHCNFLVQLTTATC